MNDDLLLVTFRANADKYKRDLDGARAYGNKRFKQMQQDADGLSQKLETMFAPLMKSGAVVAAIGGAALAVKEIATSIAEVDREARKAGVSAKVWTQWTYLASATGMSIDGVTDALKELNIRGDEFAKTGKGSAEEAFQRLGYSAADVADRLRDPSRFLDEIITKLQTLDAAAQTRILDEVFGGTGAEQMAKVLGMSVEQIQKLRSEAATFSDQQIEAAKKIDAEFATMWRNATVRMKGFAIDAAGAMAKVRDALNPGKDTYDRAVERYNSPEEQLKRLQKQRADIATAIEREKANTGNFLQQAELRNLEIALRAVDEQITDLTGGSDEFKTGLKELSAASNSLTGAFSGNTNAAANFKSALADLKNFLPELKAELDTLATTDGIDAAYNKAVSKALTMGEVMSATDIANRAKSVARYGKHDNILDLIASVESGGDYNATLDHGRWTGGAQNLTGMTLDQVRALQRRMLADPANRALYGDGKGSSALGRYQITGRTLEGLMKELGLSGDRLFDATTQDELARALLRRRGGDPESLRQEWTGLKRVDDSTIRNAYSNTPTAAQPLAPTDGERQRTELLKQQDAARKSLNQSVEEGLRLAEFERSISGMSASQQRIELEVYRLQEEARRNGITLTDAELQKMREKIALTQQLDSKNQQVARSAEGLKSAQQYFAESFTSSLSGLLTGTQTLNGALQNLLNSLIDATLQAALLGKGPLSGLLGGAGTGILGALFGFSDGGYTGDGGKYQPAGVVHKGEYVMSKKATSRIGVGNLEALHRGALSGYSDGGYVGGAPALRKPDLKAANSNAAPSPVNINTNVTVNATGGDPAQNADLAAKVGKQVEQQMRGLVADELRRQTRAGAYLNQRTR
ncbi:phage tail tape measure protein, lambda family [Rhizobium sp. RU20A]|uniref:phage tail tape measure protein n=1 Tax=Rhizobium sp. RU20A TaxID=1907412 RepID=UPI000956E12E|nr:phage tail tape measure protein [Rhizobium sp. RU20A]SIP96706.1 phage tail tape measure protein, lambda family [Rhizobium sp. RU20A]